MIDDETVQLPVVPPDGPATGSRKRRGRRRLLVFLLAVLLLLGAVVGGGLYLYTSMFTPDFDGPGTGSVIVRVQDGDTTRQIGRELTDQGVVAGAAAFINAAEADGDRARSIQPGYYQLRSRMSGEAAVELLLDPASRVGQLEIRGGVQLDDTRAPDGTVAPGVLSLIAQATCLTVDGAQRCVSVDELRAAMTGTDPAQLGVPSWALADVAKAERVIYNRLGAGRRLELDSMVNYPLDLQALRTTEADRAQPGPYNSYVVAGLPPTPISAPGKEAIAAALAPAPGPWLYFVRCQTDGTSCFAETFAEHDANVALARTNGAF
jgi:cell division protein YceG involved in septum cleavage